MLAEHGAKVVVNDFGGSRDGSGGDSGPAHHARRPSSRTVHSGSRLRRSARKSSVAATGDDM